jgi:adenosylcobyric acid synthase
VVVVRLPHISNFDDFDPLAAELGVALTYVRRPAEVADARLIVLPGPRTPATTCAGYGRAAWRRR